MDMETEKISNHIMVIKIPEDKIKEDYGISDNVLWDRIPEQLVYGFFVKNYRRLKDLWYAYPREKNYIPDWNLAKIGFEKRVPDKSMGTEKFIDIVLQREQTYYIVEIKSRKIRGALREVMGYAKLFEKEHPDCNKIQPVVVTSARNIDYLKCQFYTLG